MATAKQSICPRCGNPGFEAVHRSPKNGNIGLVYIQCISCGAVAGVYPEALLRNEFRDISDKLDEIIGNFP